MVFVVDWVAKVYRTFCSLWVMGFVALHFAGKIICYQQYTFSYDTSFPLLLRLFKIKLEIGLMWIDNRNPMSEIKALRPSQFPGKSYVWRESLWRWTLFPCVWSNIWGPLILLNLRRSIGTLSVFSFGIPEN